MTEEVSALSETEVGESSAELALNVDVDKTVLQEALEGANPDVAEAEHLNSDNQVSLSDIENAADESTIAESIADSNAEETEVLGDITNADSLETSGDGEATFSSDDWQIILVNKQHPIPDDYEFTLGTISGSKLEIIRNWM
ncbi:hypothetical protein, partial [uncultured Methanobrevibacter sp.]|uniref:hypothetical protein n=1 Tax=uncultured Methanobrevibacter sp. TaxID=253161 RepID=UPI002622272D